MIRTSHDRAIAPFSFVLRHLVGDRRAAGRAGHAAGSSRALTGAARGAGRGRRWERYLRSPSRLGVGLVWLAFLVFPVFDACMSDSHGLRYWLGIAGAVAFTGLYLWLVMRWDDRVARLGLVWSGAGLLGLAVALTIGVDSSWGFLFSYVAASMALVAPSPYAFVAVMFTSAAAGASTLLGHAGSDSAIGNAVSALGIGLLLTLMRDLRDRNIELNAARAELARTAVAAERERFARDLHDLLGHSLSVIAIKAELAGRLLPETSERAAAEVADLESVARTALSEVREAVSGYRRPTLDGELEGARIALTAAGIIAEFERSEAQLPPEVEAVLAWAVREGATNVIRHSGASHCEVRVRAAGEAVAVEVVDDGTGAGALLGGEGAVAAAGNGLAGLRERAAAVRGRLEAGAVADGGFRLAVWVPSAFGDASR